MVDERLGTRLDGSAGSEKIITEEVEIPYFKPEGSGKESK